MEEGTPDVDTIIHLHQFHPVVFFQTNCVQEALGIRRPWLLPHFWIVAYMNDTCLSKIVYTEYKQKSTV